jgi:hypothetical protein
MSGGCTRKIAEYGFNPTAPTFNAPDHRQRFLRGGHTLQAQVVEELERAGHHVYGINKHTGEEATAISRYPDLGFVLSGHCDGIFAQTQFGLLEVKAITDKMFQKVAKGSDWREQYPQYQAPAQVYMGMDEFRLGQEKWAGPFDRTCMMFLNRDSFVMIGGMPIDLPAYTYRADMVVMRDPDAHDRILERHQKAAAWSERGELPDHCDAQGWCFHCQTVGSGATHKTGNKIIYVEQSECPNAALLALEYAAIKGQLKGINARKSVVRKDLLQWMEELDPTADGFDVETPDGRVELRVKEVLSTSPDPQQVRSLVGQGDIQLVSKESIRFTADMVKKEDA